MSVCPAHNGPLADAVAAGNAFTVTLTEAVAVQPLALVTMTLYVPEFAVVAAAITGFCSVLLYDDGPLQLYVAPATVPEVRLSVCPAHTGAFDDAVAFGSALTVTLTLAVAVHPLPSVTVTL